MLNSVGGITYMLDPNPEYVSAFGEKGPLWVDKVPFEYYFGKRIKQLFPKNLMLGGDYGWALENIDPLILEYIEGKDIAKKVIYDQLIASSGPLGPYPFLGPNGHFTVV